MSEFCFNCRFKGESKPGRQIGRTRVSCLLKGGWHKDSYSCSSWKRYSPGFSCEERLREAIYYKNRNKRYETYLRHKVSGNLILIEMIALFMLLLFIGVSGGRLLFDLWK